MSQRRGTAAIPARLHRTIGHLCCCYLFYFSKPIIFSSICYSHLSYGLAPPAGRRVSEPGLRRPGKTRWSQTNKKAKAPTPRVSQSGSCHGDIKGTPAMQSPKCLPSPPPASIPPHPSSDTSQRWLNHRQMLPKSFFPPLSPPVRLFPPLVSMSGVSPHGLGSI